MPKTPDDYPGKRIEDSILIVSGTATATENGEILYVSGSGFQFFEEGVVKTLAPAGGSALTEAQHEALFTLTHQIVSSTYDVVTYANNKIDNFTTWADSSQTRKVREEQVSYSGNFVSQVISIQYNSLGVIQNVVTESIGYVGSLISSVTRVKS